MSERRSGSESKIDEYVARIKGGESKEDIMDGLPPSFIAGIENGLQEKDDDGRVIEKGGAPAPMAEPRNAPPTIPIQYEGLTAEALEFIWTVPVYADQERTKRELERKRVAVEALREVEKTSSSATLAKNEEAVAIAEIRNTLGIGSDDEVSKLRSSTEKARRYDSPDTGHLVKGLIEYVSQGRSKAVVDLYKGFFDKIDDKEARSKLASGLFSDVYNKYRIADYPADPDEEQVWEDHLQSDAVGVDNRKKEWMYRGVFPEKNEKTATRGSMNVRVTPELIASLDGMIASGRIRANYKFGQPGTTASPNERHDAISIYFLDEPSDDVLRELSDTIRPYVRGDSLLGKKIDDGFFMSEVGSIESSHVTDFVKMINDVDPALSEAVERYASPQPGRGSKLAMSEAQFYAIKDVLRAFGHEVAYDKDSGFSVT